MLSNVRDTIAVAIVYMNGSVRFYVQRVVTHEIAQPDLRGALHEVVEREINERS